jgi:ABC-type lipoprotein export system ATPase subunit
MSAIVAAIDLHRRYGEGDAAVDALADVTVEFSEGGFAAIMGPSGSGKSTLMHILAGLDLAGVLAAIGPARRAASIDVLEALAYE